MTTETAILAGGCFWGAQELLRKRPGVISTEVGYSGGDTLNATYHNHGDHAEAVKVVFDPDVISFREVLEFFFQIHDPSTKNRQGNDLGRSYRSAIFYASDEQKTIAEAYIRDLNGAHVFKDPIVTQVLSLQTYPFYATDLADHQHFLDKYPTQGYIANIDIPLLNGFKAKYPEYYTKEIK